jgi:hypothetical protein
LEAIPQHRKVAVRSGHGLGKSWSSAKIALWFLYCFYPAKVITTAPTWFQVEKILWTEMRTSHAGAKFPLGGQMNLTELKLAEDWFAIGLSTKEGVGGREFGATRMQGFHSPNLLVIMDEAAGIPPEIWKAVDSLVTGGNNRILAIGNPASPTGDFFNCFKSETWHKIHLSCLNHPNVVEGRELVPGCTTLEWVNDKKKEWGEGSALYKAKVLGDFPDEGDDTLIPLSWVEAARKRDLKPEGTKRLGVDVARMGEDKTIFCAMHGPVVSFPNEYGKKDTMYTAGQAKRTKQEGEYDLLGIDDTGVGGGVTDRLVEQDVECEAFNGGEKPIDPERFFNTRSEAYWLLRQRLDPNADDPLQLPEDDELMNQLTNMKYTITSKGQIKLESKDEIKKRIGKSPDKADALAIANYIGRREPEPNIIIIGE